MSKQVKQLHSGSIKPEKETPKKEKTYTQQELDAIVKDKVHKAEKYLILRYNTKAKFINELHDLTVPIIVHQGTFVKKFCKRNGLLVSEFHTLLSCYTWYRKFTTKPYFHQKAIDAFMTGGEYKPVRLKTLHRKGFLKFLGKIMFNNNGEIINPDTRKFNHYAIEDSMMRKLDKLSSDVSIHLKEVKEACDKIPEFRAVLSSLTPDPRYTVEWSCRKNKRDDMEYLNL